MNLVFSSVRRLFGLCSLSSTKNSVQIKMLSRPPHTTNPSIFQNHKAIDGKNIEKCEKWDFKVHYLRMLEKASIGSFNPSLFRHCDNSEMKIGLPMHFYAYIVFLTSKQGVVCESRILKLSVWGLEIQRIKSMYYFIPTLLVRGNRVLTWALYVMYSARGVGEVTTSDIFSVSTSTSSIFSQLMHCRNVA